MDESKQKDLWLKNTPCHGGKYGCGENRACSKRPVFNDTSRNRYHNRRMSGRIAGPSGHNVYCAIAAADKLVTNSGFHEETTVITVCGCIGKAAIPLWHEGEASKMNCPDCRRILRDAGFDPDLEQK